ncbi:Serine/threonine protein kinase PrkC, regulator of stationary phase [Nostoc sphaeroides CCNUC1]|uniref:Serine/threonine protein kinase PrkC, regulator of stationary phase n=1 Tax=Nostoc sphaeroides CCNUC1 TaxID=2653204 RepID=A0A5P8W6M9_9NOSO|nr:Serine/threonine protein kinase PrkC, regulator of stationary phase [Nostoc sphaeroides CCNUC1]
MGRSFKKIKSNPNRITIKTSLENEGVKIALAKPAVPFGKQATRSVSQRRHR